MKLEGIATFVSVVESGSLSEAARRLRVSRSVVSERLVLADWLREAFGSPPYWDVS